MIVSPFSCLSLSPSPYLHELSDDAMILTSLSTNDHDLSFCYVPLAPLLLSLILSI